MGGQPNEKLIEYAAIAPLVEPRGETYRENVELALPTQWKLNKYAAIAQLVEQGTENPCVLGSIPSCGIFFCSNNEGFSPRFILCKIISIKIVVILSVKV